MFTLLVMYVAAGLLLSALSIPLILRKVGPNPFYGFRVRQTLDDPRVWYDVNAYAARWLLGVSLVTVAAALGLAAVPAIGVAPYALSVTAVFGAVLAAALVASFRYLFRITTPSTPATKPRG